jgi:glutamate-1-semialdehyde 2,1-aminomutase
MRIDPAPESRSFVRSTEAQQRLHELVPGGAHTYARGADQYPDGMAPVLVRGEGAHVLDLDDNWYVEYGMGLRAVTLGHGYAPVVDAAYRAARDGMSFSRPSVWEIKAAECFLGHVPGAEMVKFAKNGSDATTAAIKLARAATGRDMVAICNTQPFFSTDDWFIGVTAMNAGTVESQRPLTVGFPFNDLVALQRLVDEHPDQIACLILEGGTGVQEPEPGYLEGVRAIASANGIVLVFDEMITGMRWGLGGAQGEYGVTPDLSTWGKALGNGFPLSALAGRRDLMELGGLNTDSERAFLLSTTHGPETSSLAAYLAVVDAYRERDVVGVMERQGRKLAALVAEISGELGIREQVTTLGRPSCLLFTTRDGEGQPSNEFRTLFMQEMLSRGVLGMSFVISAAHTDEDIEATAEALRGALGVYARALDAGSTEGFLRGRPIAPAIRTLAAPRRLRADETGSTSGSTHRELG